MFSDTEGGYVRDYLGYDIAWPFAMNAIFERCLKMLEWPEEYERN